MTDSEVYLGAVYDAMHMLGFRAEQFFINIKPLAGYTKLISGPALTTSGRIVSQDEDYKSLDNIRLQIYRKDYFACNPVVLLEANDNYVAHSGDITSLIYKNLGAIGFVTDGNVRDIDLIDELDFPTFASSANPIDALDYWALDRYNVDIRLHNVLVSPGDIIYASRDGVIRVPKNFQAQFQEKLISVLDKEKRARNLIKGIFQQETEDIQAALEKFVLEQGRW